jgi:putative addiction module component (TIGR02574 family)
VEVGGITVLRQPARQAAAKLSTTTLLHAMVGDEASEPVDELFHLTPLRRLLLESVDAESEEGVEDTWRIEVDCRMAELDSATVKTPPWEELRARLYRR